MSSFTTAHKHNAIQWEDKSRLAYVGLLLISRHHEVIRNPRWWMADRCRSHAFPVLEILTRSGDIRDQCLKLCDIASNFACF